MEQRNLALDEKRLRLLRLEEHDAGWIVGHGPHHLVERADAGGRVDQRLHVAVEVVATVREEPRAPPVVRKTAAGGLVRRARPEKFPVASVPAPAVEELRLVVPL